MRNEIKVLKMNDYEWYATKWSIEETNKWYKENIAENDIEDIGICDLDKHGVWCPTEDEKDIEKLKDTDKVIRIDDEHKLMFGNLIKMDGEVYKYISLREAILKNADFREPYCIASTEW